MNTRTLLPTALALIILPLAAYADIETVDGVEWIYYVSDGKATVSRGYSSSAVPQSTLGALTIPATLGGYPVTSIGIRAFDGCSGLTSVTIPNSVTSIGEEAFSGCNSALYDISSILGVKLIDGWAVGYESSLSGNLDLTGCRGIGFSAFKDCSGLTSVKIPNAVTSIGRYTFKGCSGLTSVTIPNSVTSIGSYAFGGCRGLTAWTIPDSVTSIGDYAFSGCRGLTSVVIPDSVTSIGSYAFYGCGGIMSATVPGRFVMTMKWLFPDSYQSISNVVIIGESGLPNDAFEDCRGLTSVTILDGTSNIGNSAFYGCSGLTSVTIPNSVTNIGNYAFFGCSSLTSVTIPNSVTSIGNYAFKGCSGLTSVTIPNSVTSIGNYAFSGCSSLTSVTIPNSVTSIGSTPFKGCSAVKNITLPGQFRVWRLFQDSWFLNENLTNVVIAAGSQNMIGTLEGCVGLQNFTIPNSVTNIGDYAFYNCYGLSSITIPEGVISIGEKAFSGCYKSISSKSFGLRFVSIPQSVTAIGRGAFQGDALLESIIIPDGVTHLADYLFADCNYLQYITISSSISEIGDHTFQGCRSGPVTRINIHDLDAWVTNTINSKLVGGRHLWVDGTEITRYIVPEGTKIIEPYVFKGCQIDEIVVPEGTEIIGDHAFEGCLMNKFSLPGSVTNIGNYAFSGVALKSNGSIFGQFVIPDSVVHIGDYAFSSWYFTYEIRIPTSLKRIGKGVFSNCGCGSFMIPDGVQSIGESAFSGCSLWGGITIPNSVTNIGANAFDGCNGLPSATIPDSVTSIGHWAFFGCSNLQTLHLPSRFKGHTDSLGIPAGCQIIFADIPDATVSGTTLTVGGDGGIQGNFADDPAIQAHAAEIETIIVGDGVTGIGQNAFAGLPNVTTVILPETLEEIDPDAFAGCDNLEMLYLPPAFFDGIDRLDIPDTCNVVGTDVYAFAKRLYNLCLNREPDQDGVNDWSMQLASGANDGANVAFGFFMSLEMVNRNLSNEDFVEILYNVMMNRASDAGGKAYWVDALNNGVSRAGALRGFAESAEFTRICGDYGINRGDVNRNYLEARDLNFGIAMFVARCYTKALGRAYDVDGLNYWCYRIISSPNPRAEAIYVSTTGFFDSQEFQLRGLSNSAFVDVLYQTFLGRAADAGGRADWVRQLNAGADRHAIMAGFYNSAEFNAIMAQYGL